MPSELDSTAWEALLCKKLCSTRSGQPLSYLKTQMQARSIMLCFSVRRTTAQLHVLLNNTYFRPTCLAISEVTFQRVAVCVLQVAVIVRPCPSVRRQGRQVEGVLQRVVQSQAKWHVRCELAQIQLVLCVMIVSRTVCINCGAANVGSTCTIGNCSVCNQSASEQVVFLIRLKEFFKSNGLPYRQPGRAPAELVISSGGTPRRHTPVQ